MIIFGFFTILISSILNNHLLLSSPLFFLCHKYIYVYGGQILYSISAVMAQTRLDIVVYADSMSEPMNYFLQFGRVAPIQVNP